MVITNHLFTKKDFIEKDAIVDPNNNNHFEYVHGIPPYDYMEKNAELNDIFFLQSKNPRCPTRIEKGTQIIHRI